MPELKPCPFCGCNLSEYRGRKQGGKPFVTWFHPTNGCVFLLSRLETEDEIEAWNRRADNG